MTAMTTAAASSLSVRARSTYNAVKADEHFPIGATSMARLLLELSEKVDVLERQIGRQLVYTVECSKCNEPDCEQHDEYYHLVSCERIRDNWPTDLTLAEAAKRLKPCPECLGR